MKQDQMPESPTPGHVTYAQPLPLSIGRGGDWGKPGSTAPCKGGSCLTSTQALPGRGVGLPCQASNFSRKARNPDFYMQSLNLKILHYIF